MTSGFSLQNPYVVASLPRPIDHSAGRYVVGEVYGGVPGTKKRKRTELAVGIDGESVNLYDIPSSRLITSYALPPQSSFTCPPTSIRSRASKSKIERRTYVSTTGSEAKISLFSEISIGPTSSTSTTTTRSVENSQNPIVFLGTAAATRGTDVSGQGLDLVAVKENGEILCYDGESLEEKWTSPASALGRDVPTSMKDAKVEFAQFTNAYSASQGMLKGRQDVFAIFPREISEDGFNPEILVIITKSSSARTLHITILPRRAAAQLNGLKHSIESFVSVDLPSHDSGADESKPSFSLQPSAGILQQLSGSILRTFDLTDGLPKEISKSKSPGALSFLRLSSTSIMISNETAITVYNPKYQSVLATIELEGSAKPESLKRKRGTEEVNGISSQGCDFVTYFPKLGLALAIASNNLIAVQVEGQQDRHGRPRAAGLLIDSLGCSVKEQLRPGRGQMKSNIELDLKTLGSYLPGSIGIMEAPWGEQIVEFEATVSKGDVAAFDILMASHLGVQRPDESKFNGNGPSTNQNGTKSLRPSSDVDQRWISYALSKIFSISEEDGAQRLSIAFYPPNVFMWLLTTGNMTVTNIEIALRQIAIPSSKSIQAGDLVDLLVEMDPDMDLLLALLAKNFLGAAELLHGIRRLMESLGLFGEDATTKQALLKNGEDAESENGDPEEQFQRLEAEAENDLAIAEYHLGPGSTVRGQALSVALSKLYTCPTNTIIYALQTTFTAPEIVSLIYLLRFELARGAWTSKYLDTSTQSELIDEEADIPDNAIILISSLLNNCVDAIGTGGWLTGDARLVNGDPFEAEELIASLKLEVSAALEGIEEAEYLKGLTAEMVRYGEAVLRALPVEEKEGDEVPAGKKTKISKPVLVPMGEQEKLLPLGLKADKLISLRRVGAGGEVQKRSMRDIGHLKSQKVGKYTLERIVV